VSAYGSAGGESDLSVFTSAATQGLTAPTGISASALSLSSIQITWDPVAGASSYRVYRSTNANGSYIRINENSATSYTDTGLTAGTTYYYKVSVYSAGKESVLSEFASVTTFYAVYTAYSLATFRNAVTAINNNTAGGTYRITVTGSFAASGISFASNAEKTITIEGDSTVRTISNGNTSAPLFTIPGGIELVLGNNICLDGSGKEYSLVLINSGGTLTMNSGAKIIGATASGVRIEDGVFTMNDGEISSNFLSSGYGGGVYVASGCFVMDGGTISDNSSSASISSSYSSSSPDYYSYSYGGGVYVAGGTFTMKGGTISANSAASTYSDAYSYSYGGGVYVAGGTFTMSCGTIRGNSV
jgi:hypothetical protein